MAEQRHGVPLLISFFIPGLGQLIKGDWVSALFFFGANVLGGLLCLVAVGFVLLPIVWIWNLYDAYVAPDGQTKRELKRLAKLAIVLAFGLGIVGCGSVTAETPPDGGGTGGMAGKVGVTATGGEASAGTGGQGGVGGAAGARGLGGEASDGGIRCSSSAMCPGTEPVCFDGRCTPACSPGQTQCGTACTNTASDSNNCGACAAACAAGHACSGGRCS